MLKAAYLRQKDVSDFCVWLADIVAGAQPFAFQHAKTGHYRWLSDAFGAYAWPARATSGVHQTPGMAFSLPARSSFAANEAVLKDLQAGLREALADQPVDPREVAKWVASIFKWGGVYTEKKNKAGALIGGNRHWLDQHAATIDTILHQVRREIALQDDDCGLPSLRFNSGMTKVYALLLDDFIIYDSRVAATLAWLVLQFRRRSGVQPVQAVGPNLRFGCMVANQSPAAAHRKLRNPDRTVFANMSAAPFEHYRWNLRANWVLVEAFARAKALAPGAGARPFRSVREIEAALFQAGADLHWA